MRPVVLVTGATGNLGPHVVARLIADGLSVAILHRPQSPLDSLARFAGSLDFRSGDVCDRSSLFRAVQDIESVYHLAGISLPLNRLERLMWAVNVEGTRNLCEAAGQQGVRRIVHVSAAAAIGYPPPSVAANESFRFTDSVTMNAYARTKRSGEEVALGFSSEAMGVVVVNPCTVLAPGLRLRYGWSALVSAARRGLLLTAPRGSSGICTMDDFLDGLVRAAFCGRPGERYILNTCNISHFAVARMITELVGGRPPSMALPRWAMLLLGRFNDLLGSLVSDPQRYPILVSENVDLLSRDLHYDQSKAVRELGMSQSSLAEALLAAVVAVLAAQAPTR